MHATPAAHVIQTSAVRHSTRCPAPSPSYSLPLASLSHCVRLAPPTFALTSSSICSRLARTRAFKSSMDFVRRSRGVRREKSPSMSASQPTIGAAPVTMRAAGRGRAPARAPGAGNRRRAARGEDRREAQGRRQRAEPLTRGAVLQVGLEFQVLHALLDERDQRARRDVVRVHLHLLDARLEAEGEGRVVEACARAGRAVGRANLNARACSGRWPGSAREGAKLKAAEGTRGPASGAEALQMPREAGPGHAVFLFKPAGHLTPGGTGTPGS